MTHEQHHQHESEKAPTVRPAVWIGCLAAYNNGHLHGDWINADEGPEALSEATRRILATSPEPDAEEHAIFDYEGFGAFNVGEYESLDTLAAIATGIARHGAAFAAWAELHDADPAMMECFEDAYLGHYDSTEDWAHHVLEDLGVEKQLDQAIPESLRGYVTVDYAAWARDAGASDIHIEPAPGGKVWVFTMT